MDLPPTPTESKDAEHLRLLSIFHYVVAGLTFLFACFPVIHLVMGVLIVTGKFNTQGANVPPRFMGFMFIVMGGIFILAGWTLAACALISGRMLAQRKHKTFSIVVAALLCMLVPFGTVLGVFTIIVLSRDSVQRQYEHSAA